MDLTANSILSFFAFAAGITVGNALLQPVATQVQDAISRK